MTLVTPRQLWCKSSTYPNKFLFLTPFVYIIPSLDFICVYFIACILFNLVAGF